MSVIDDTAEEIRRMQTHSSSAVAVKAARALTGLLDREFASVDAFEVALERNSNALRRASASHASLHTTQREIRERVEDSDPATVDEAKAATRQAIDAVVGEVNRATDAAAANLADRLDPGDTVLTHDYSTTVVGALRSAVDDVDADGTGGLTVYVTEARPRFIGRRTARELSEVAGIEVQMLVDSAAGVYLGDCDAVAVGMDCIVGDTLYNRVGTYPIAATATDVGTPVFVAGASTKVVEGGFQFETTHRNASEVLREPAEFAVENPAYDATPLRLVDEVVTD
jgi:translation initiation factor eIF-2B subunit delta